MVVGLAEPKRPSTLGSICRPWRSTGSRAAVARRWNRPLGRHRPRRRRLRSPQQGRRPGRRPRTLTRRTRLTPTRRPCGSSGGTPPGSIASGTRRRGARPSSPAPPSSPSVGTSRATTPSLPGLMTERRSPEVRRPRLRLINELGKYPYLSIHDEVYGLPVRSVFDPKEPDS